ncbi:MAG: hypothetical protein WBD99_03505 [Thermodesulfobacteriota bacterium]
MKFLVMVTLLFTLFAFISCDSLDEVIPETGSPDPLITFEDANDQDYNLTTPLYGMKVAIRGDVSGNVEDILDKLDNRAANFLECQFGDPNVGFEDVEIGNGEMIPPLSELKVFVVPITFKCEGLTTDVCAGVYFAGPGVDLTIISKRTIGQCNDFSFFKHELAHRYGMEADHSNSGDFEPCKDAPECELPFDIGG